MGRFTGFVITTVLLEPMLIALWIAVGSGRQRRSHFWFRALLAVLALPALMGVLAGVTRLPDAVLGAAGLPLLLLLFCSGVVALLLVPALLYRRAGPAPGPNESDGGGGPGPERPRPSPGSPRGGVPLPDAAQARARSRDHQAPKFDGRKTRRPTHEPLRTPVATSG